MKHKQQKGQTLLEFLLLLASIITISLTIQSGFARGLGRIWLKMIQTLVPESVIVLR